MLQKIQIYQKMFQTKVAENLISYKKLGGHISLFISGVELEGVEDLQFLKYNNAEQWESRITLGLNTTKNIDYIENCFEQKLHGIKFPTINSRMRISIFPRSGVKRLQRFAF